MMNWNEDDFHSILKNRSIGCSNVLKTEGDKFGLTIASLIY